MKEENTNQEKQSSETNTSSFKSEVSGRLTLRQRTYIVYMFSDLMGLEKEDLIELVRHIHTHENYINRNGIPPDPIDLEFIRNKITDMKLPADDRMWLCTLFDQMLSSDKQEGLISLTLGKEDGSWTLQYPDTSTIIGFNNPYDFLDEEKLKAWEDSYADKCVKFLRSQFSELYQTKEKPVSNEKR